MEIRGYLNCSKIRIKKKEFNIFIGISLGNKYFSKGNLKKYFAWAIKNTKTNVLIIIADSNHAINYEVFNNYSTEKALRHALRDGDRIMEMITEIIAEYPLESQNMFKICRWEELRKSPYYQKNKQIIWKEFNENLEFQNYVLNIVTENLGNRIVGLAVLSRKKLAEYILDELPIMINGVDYQGSVYNLYPYPGLSSYNTLITGLQDKNIFQNLSNKLNIKNKIAMVEML